MMLIQKEEETDKQEALRLCWHYRKKLQLVFVVHRIIYKQLNNQPVNATTIPYQTIDSIRADFGPVANF